MPAHPTTRRARCAPGARCPMRVPSAAPDACDLDSGRPVAHNAPRHARPKPRVELSGLQIRFCGVRGSIPSPGIEFVRYGGHTPCLALAHDGAAAPSLILDAGTGI